MSANPTVAALLAAYPWYDHEEGMKFAELHRDAHRTVGHWLFLPGRISAFHRLDHCEEIWALHQGGLILHLLEPGGTLRQLRLGLDFAAGARPVAIVPRGCWQAAELPDGADFAFGSNVCAPGFSPAHLELGRRTQLKAAFPQHAAVITRLTHEQGG